MAYIRLLQILLMFFSLGSHSYTPLIYTDIMPNVMRDTLTIDHVHNEIEQSVRYIDSLQYDSAFNHLALCLERYPELMTQHDTLHARILIIMGAAAQKMQKFDLALSHIEKAFEVCKSIPEDQNGLYPEGLSVLAELYLNQDKHQLSIEKYEEAIRYYSIVHGNEYVKIGNMLNNMAQVYEKKGDFSTALSIHNRAIAFKKKNRVPLLAELSTSYRNKGTTFQYLNQVDSAIIYHSKALQLKREIYGDDHSEVITMYQNLGTAYGQLGDYNQQVKALEKAKVYFDSPVGVRDPSRAQFYSNLGVAYKNKGNLEQAKEAMNNALRIREERNEEKTVDLAIVFLNLATIHVDLGQYKNAKAYCEKALRSIPNHLRENFSHLAAIYNTLGLIYSNLGDKDLAVSYYEKSIDQNIRNYGLNSSNLLYAYHNIARQYHENGFYHKAIQYEELALSSHLLFFSEVHPNTPYFYNGMANAYLRLNQYSSAREYYNKSLSIYRDLKAFNSRDRANMHFNLFFVDLKELKFLEAQENINKAIGLVEKSLDQSYPSLAILEYYKGVLSYRMGEYDQAIALFNSALRNYGYIEKNNFHVVNQVQKVVDALQYLVRSYQKKMEESDNLLDIQMTFDLIEESRLGLTYQKEMLSPDSKFSLASEFRESCELALENVGLILRNGMGTSEVYSKAFEMIERSRSQELLGAKQDFQAMHYSSVPDSLVVKDYSFRIEMSGLEKMKYKINNVRDTQYLKYAKRLSAVKVMYDSFKYDLHRNYPDYHDVRFESPPIGMMALQNQLSLCGKMLVEYFVGDSSIFTFTVLPDTFYLHQINKDFPLETWVEDMLHGIYDPYTPGATELEREYSFQQAASSIYQKVFRHVDTLLPEGTEIILVPDGILGYIPFDILVTDSTDSESYLIRDHQIGYAYSATLHAEMENMQHDHQAQRKILAFAPSFDHFEATGDTSILASRFIDVSNTRNWLGPLKYNDDEVQSISQMVPTDVFLGSTATKDQFLQNASDYSIIHLSTHGKANDKMGDYSFLAFYDPQDSSETWLYNRELYGLDLNADMVVLSACETGIGELQRGEGIISLARGFSYAGAKSIITTLWSVNDRSTQKVMELFYSNLANGMPKDAALRQAKLDYLNQYPHLGKSPYFWAGIIPIGDMSPISFQSIWYQNPWIWMSIILLLALGIWAIRKNFEFFLKK